MIVIDRPYPGQKVRCTFFLTIESTTGGQIGGIIDIHGVTRFIPNQPQRPPQRPGGPYVTVLIIDLCTLYTADQLTAGTQIDITVGTPGQAVTITVFLGQTCTC